MKYTQEYVCTNPECGLYFKIVKVLGEPGDKYHKCPGCGNLMERV